MWKIGCNLSRFLLRKYPNVIFEMVFFISNTNLFSRFCMEFFCHFKVISNNTCRNPRHHLLSSCFILLCCERKLWHKIGRNIWGIFYTVAFPFLAGLRNCFLRKAVFGKWWSNCDMILVVITTTSHVISFRNLSKCLEG